MKVLWAWLEPVGWTLHSGNADCHASQGTMVACTFSCCGSTFNIIVLCIVRMFYFPLFFLSAFVKKTLVNTSMSNFCFPPPLPVPPFFFFSCHASTVASAAVISQRRWNFFKRHFCHLSPCVFSRGWELQRHFGLEDIYLHMPVGCQHVSFNGGLLLWMDQLSRQPSPQHQMEKSLAHIQLKPLLRS